MRSWPKLLFLSIVAGSLLYSCTKDDEDFWDWMVPETEDTTTSAEIKGYVFRPALVPATEQNVKQLKVPAGFKVNKFADQMGKPRILVVSNSGMCMFLTASAVL